MKEQRSYLSPIIYQRLLTPRQALYDFEYETDKICVIQSVLLMGYWLGNAHDRMDSWHWVGIAISLSQSVGLHRDVGCSRIPASQRALWRRIWWCCFYRDRSISLGMGRACRIDLKDCDVQDVSLEDLVCNVSLSDLTAEGASVVTRCNDFAPVFLEIVQGGRLLGDALASVYRPRQREAFPDDDSWRLAEDITERLSAWQAALDPRCRIDTAPVAGVNDLAAMTLHKYFIQILYQ